MATMIDFAPLFRTGIGFDRMLEALEAANRGQTADKWPPYDIIKMGDDAYRIDMAVAGFAEGDLNLTQDKNILIVAGTKESSEREDGYLHRGIASRSFERRFELADHVRVEAAQLANGLLTIELKREIPEELKPRRIEIASPGQPPEKTRRIDATREPHRWPPDVSRRVMRRRRRILRRLRNAEIVPLIRQPRSVPDLNPLTKVGGP